LPEPKIGISFREEDADELPSQASSFKKESAKEKAGSELFMAFFQSVCPRVAEG
jgi:hypothetical protein